MSKQLGRPSVAIRMQLTQDEKAFLEKCTLDEVFGVRAQIVLLAARAPQTAEEIADALGVTKRLVYHHLSKWRVFGMQLTGRGVAPARTRDAYHMIGTECPTCRHIHTPVSAARACGVSKQAVWAYAKRVKAGTETEQIVDPGY